MLYVGDEKLLIAAFYDSTIRIYDEGDSEETVLLKVHSLLLLLLLPIFAFPNSNKQRNEFGRL